jgi:hypothetical protein
VLGAEALTRDLDEVRSMGQPIEGGGGQQGLPEELRPFRPIAIRGQENRTPGEGFAVSYEATAGRLTPNPRWSWLGCTDQYRCDVRVVLLHQVQLAPQLDLAGGVARVVYFPCPVW